MKWILVYTYIISSSSNDIRSGTGRFPAENIALKQKRKQT